MILHSKIIGFGKPLLILHGFFGMSDNWKTLGVQFATEEFEVHILDLRNHGRSFHSTEFSYELMVQDVAVYCQEHNLENINVIGHSMGGKTAMLLAARFPELVEKLIVADIGSKYYAPHHQSILAGLNAVDFSKKPSRNEVEEILSQHILDFSTRQFLLKNLYWKEPNQLAFRFNLITLTERVIEIGEPLPLDLVFKKPVLFIRGGNSDYILDSDFEGIKEHFPNAYLETIPNAGHWLHAEDPALFYKMTVSYLKQN